MGPRSFDRGDIETLTVPVPRATLQWGRGLLTAEMPRAQSGSLPVSALQWGRGLLTAEMRAVREALPALL